MSKNHSSRKDKEALALHRQRLKAQLWQYGRAETRSPWPACCYCGERIQRPDHCVMHEWLIRRGRLPLDQQIKIMTKYNCVLLHTWCSEQHETTEECKLACARAQYKRYSREATVAWVDSLGLRQYVEIPE